MSKAQLPADIWLEISESYLEQIDIVQLSETCKYLRLCVQPHLFRRLSLVGFVGRRQCPQECIATLLLVERRIQKFLATTHLLQCIHEVEIWNWMGCPLKPSIPVCPVSTEDCDHIPHKKAYVCEYVHLGKSDTCLVAEQELVDLWRNVYGILSDFIASLPELRKVTITECLHSKYDHRAFPVMDLQCLMRRVQAVNCLSFEYSISGTLGPFILPVPNTFGRYSTDLGHTTILDSYFFEVPNANKHPITAARVSLRFLSLLMAQLECKASSILRLGIVINSRCPTTEGKRTLQELILEICPRLTSLEIWNLCEDKCCWPFLSAGDRSLEVVTGSPGVIASILHLDSINAVRIIEINPDRLIQRFQSLTIVAKTVRSLDVSGLHFWNSQLIVQLAVTMPNVQYLTISWMADLTVADLETILVNIIEIFQPLMHLRSLHIPTIPVEEAELAMPKDSQLSAARGHMSLTNIKIGEGLEFSWYQHRGWLYQGVIMVSSPLTITTRISALATTQSRRSWNTSYIQVSKTPSLPKTPSTPTSKFNKLIRFWKK